MYVHVHPRIHFLPSEGFPQCIYLGTRFVSRTVCSTSWSGNMPTQSACVCHIQILYNEDFRYVGPLGVLGSKLINCE